jgi:hypothetical protein
MQSYPLNQPSDQGGQIIMQNFLPECIESESGKLRYLASRCLATRKQIKFLKTHYIREIQQLQTNMKHDLDNLTLELERLELDIHHQRDRLADQDDEEEFLLEGFVK